VTQIRELSDGRLHLQHGPIDCLLRAWGEQAEIRSAYRQAANAFSHILPALCAELPMLRSALPSPVPVGPVARAMHRAVLPFAAGFITPMAAVAGAVADHVLAALVDGSRLDRAFVNNGGDIAFHLAPSQSLRCGLVSDLADPALDGAFLLEADHPARGLATSGRACKGRGGRSFSFGIADSVSVLAHTAAQADAAATVIANAVDIPGHQAIHRVPACDIDPDTDLGALLVTCDVGTLGHADIAAALDAGADVADDLMEAGLILGAVLCLRGQMIVRAPHALELA
jgi:ApbE superfamily uncharacterized protein (UPF0280 family)